MYKLVEGGVIRLKDMAFIPDDPANRDWQEYLEWVAEGNAPEPPHTPEELRQRRKGEMLSLKRARILRVLSEAQYEDLADLKIHADAGDQKAQELLKWYLEYARLTREVIERDLPQANPEEFDPVKEEERCFRWSRGSRGLGNANPRNV